MVLRTQMKIIIENQVCVTAMVRGLEDKDNSDIPTQVPATSSITIAISTVNEPDV